MAPGNPQHPRAPLPSVRMVAHLVYALHTVAMVLNYVMRSDARGTWVYSHYQWQIRIFWYALLWALIGWGLILTLIGAVVGMPILIALTLWLLYRIGRGWLRLRDHRPMYTL